MNKKIVPFETVKRAIFLLSLSSFIVALSVAIYVYYNVNLYLPDVKVWHGVLFIAMSLYMIQMGNTVNSYNYLSFDRITQIASILIFGPFFSATLAFISYFLFTLKYINSPVSFVSVLSSCLFNSSMMFLTLLGAGLGYEYLSAPMPLLELSLETILKLIFLILLIQLINKLILQIWLYVRKVDGVYNTPQKLDQY